MPAALTRQKRSFKIAKLEMREDKNDNGQEVGIITGYLAAYGNRDSYGTVLMPGCFAKSIDEHDTFPLLADHKADMPIGGFTAREDSKGLYIEAEVLLGVQAGKEKWLLLMAKAISGLSVGFSSIKDEWDEKTGVLRYTECKLWEGSVVTFPANELAGVDSVRSMEGEARSAAEPLALMLERLSQALPQVGQAALGDENARGYVLTLLDEAALEIEALRSKLENAAASDETEAPAEGHLSDEDVKELCAMTDSITTQAQALTAAA